jgi:hypothetical protein
MKVEIKLKDFAFCDGCPLLYDTLCMAGNKLENDIDGKQPRPPECVRRNGS